MQTRLSRLSKFLPIQTERQVIPLEMRRLPILDTSHRPHFHLIRFLANQVGAYYDQFLGYLDHLRLVDFSTMESNCFLQLFHLVSIHHQMCLVWSKTQLSINLKQYKYSCRYSAINLCLVNKVSDFLKKVYEKVSFL